MTVVGAVTEVRGVVALAVRCVVAVRASDVLLVVTFCVCVTDWSVMGWTGVSEVVTLLAKSVSVGVVACPTDSDETTSLALLLSEGLLSTGVSVTGGTKSVIVSSGNTTGVFGTHASNVSGVAVVSLAVLVSSSDLADAGKTIGVAAVDSSIVAVLVAGSVVLSLTTLTVIADDAAIVVSSANTGLANKTLANRRVAVSKLDF